MKNQSSVLSKNENLQSTFKKLGQTKLYEQNYEKMMFWIGLTINLISLETGNKLLS